MMIAAVISETRLSQFDILTAVMMQQKKKHDRVWVRRETKNRNPKCTGPTRKGHQGGSTLSEFTFFMEVFYRILCGHPLWPLWTLKRNVTLGAHSFLNFRFDTTTSSMNWNKLKFPLLGLSSARFWVGCVQNKWNCSELHQPCKSTEVESQSRDLFRALKQDTRWG